VKKEETVHSLVDTWATLNLGNAALTAAAAMSALWAVMNPVEVVGMGLDSIKFGTGANRMG